MAAVGLAGTLLVAISLAGAPPSDTLRVKGWRMIGPFTAGSREPLADPAWPFDPAGPTSSLGDSMPSMLGPGGWVRWKELAPDGDRIPLAYEGTEWDALAESWGAAGVVSAGIVTGELDVPRAGAFLIDAAGIGSFTIDARRYVGNPYASASPFLTPAVLDAGRHRVVLRVGGMGPRDVRFRLVAQSAPVVLLEKDVTLPDLVVGEPLEGWGAVAIVNLSGRRLADCVLRFGDGEKIAATTVPIPPLESEAILKVPFPIRTLRSPAAGERYPEEIVIDSPAGAAALACSLRVRDPHATRLATFRSREDGSVQKYGLLPPSADGPGPFALILSLHGASCDPEPQVASYVPKDWAYVVAPTNTRPYGFDWQDWGRRNAISTLDQVLARHPIDPDRVLLAGHSMGGHGTWHVGISHADRFAGLAPSAGWASLPTYVPFTLRRDVNGADPRLLAITQRAVAPDNPFPLLANLRGMPVFVLHGSKDDNVPVFQGRLLAARALEAGAAVTYREVPEMGHWWDDPATPGVDCVDLAAMMDSLRGWCRDPLPRSVTLRTYDLGTCDRSHWLTVEEAEHPFDPVTVDARADEDGSITLTSAGARAIAIEPRGLAVPGKIAFTLDGDRLSAAWREGPVRFRKDGMDWKRVDGPPPVARRAPIKAPFFAPFALVYETGGSPEENETARRLAVLDAQAWYLRADGYAPVLPDTAVTAEILAERNLILYATPGGHAILRKVAGALPIRVSRDRITLAGRGYEGSMATRFAYPNPLAPGRLIEVVAGTDRAALELAAASNPCYSGSGYPDFIVYDAEARRLGWGAVKAAGFFDAEGRVPVEGRDAVLRDP
jgi:predicted esterase